MWLIVARVVSCWKQCSIFDVMQCFYETFLGTENRLLNICLKNKSFLKYVCYSNHMCKSFQIVTLWCPRAMYDYHALDTSYVNTTLLTNNSINSHHVFSRRSKFETVAIFACENIPILTLIVGFHTKKLFHIYLLRVCFLLSMEMSITVRGCGTFSIKRYIMLVFIPFACSPTCDCIIYSLLGYVRLSLAFFFSMVYARLWRWSRASLFFATDYNIMP